MPIPQTKRLVRLTHRYSNGHAFCGVETVMSDVQLNRVIAYIQKVRDGLPIMDIQHNDTLAEPDCAYVLEQLFECKTVKADGGKECDSEIDLFRNWDLVSTLDYSDITIKETDVVAALLDDFIHQAQEIMGQYATPADRLKEEYAHLLAMREGKPALPEWGLRTINGDAVIGVVC